MPMQSGAHRESCNFSFSGIKTSVAKLIEAERKRLGLSPQLYVGPGAVSTAGEKPKQSTESVSCDGCGGGEGTWYNGQHEEEEGVVTELHRATCLIALGFQRVSVRFLQQRTRRALQWLAEDSKQQVKHPIHTSQMANPIIFDMFCPCRPG